VLEITFVTILLNTHDTAQSNEVFFTHILIFTAAL